MSISQSKQHYINKLQADIRHKLYLNPDQYFFKFSLSMRPACFTHLEWVNLILDSVSIIAGPVLGFKVHTNKRNGRKQLIVESTRQLLARP